MDGRGRSSGFTLAELIITVSIAAIILAVAVPGFGRTIVSSRLSSTANAFVASLSQARLEAVRRNSATQFCSNLAANNTGDALGSACTGPGAVVVQEIAGAPTPIRKEVTLPSDLLLGDGSGGTTGVAALRYTGRGLASTAAGTNPYTGLVADVYSQRFSTNNHRCIYLTTGSIVSSCTTSGAACPANEPTPCQR